MAPVGNKLQAGKKGHLLVCLSRVTLTLVHCTGLCDPLTRPVSPAGRMWAVGSTASPLTLEERGPGVLFLHPHLSGQQLGWLSGLPLSQPDRGGVPLPSLLSLMSVVRLSGPGLGTTVYCQPWGPSPSSS